MNIYEGERRGGCDVIIKAWKILGMRENSVNFHFFILVDTLDLNLDTVLNLSLIHISEPTRPY